jgi:two-component system cell cycle sensor histidine kinase/response regulator CckA
MPGLSGSDIFDQLKLLKPNLKTILSSGYSPNGQATDILARGCCGFLQKTFNITELSQKVREILDAAKNHHPS